MTDATYEPPKVWKWDPDNEQAFANINRPTSGAQQEKELTRLDSEINPVDRTGTAKDLGQILKGNSYRFHAHILLNSHLPASCGFDPQLSRKRPERSSNSVCPSQRIFQPAILRA